MNPIDWTLIAIANAEGDLEPVQLQKSLFLFGQQLKSRQLKTRSFYKFEPYDYGPFCSMVYSDAEELERAGLITIQRPPEARYKLYSATADGKKRAKELERELATDVTAYTREIIRFTQKLTFDELVSAIYKAYPKMKVNSVFQE